MYSAVDSGANNMSLDMLQVASYGACKVSTNSMIVFQPLHSFGISVGRWICLAPIFINLFYVKLGVKGVSIMYSWVCFWISQSVVVSNNLGRV